MIDQPIARTIDRRLLMLFLVVNSQAKTNVLGYAKSHDRMSRPSKRGQRREYALFFPRKMLHSKCTCKRLASAQESLCQTVHNLLALETLSQNEVWHFSAEENTRIDRDRRSNPHYVPNAKGAIGA